MNNPEEFTNLKLVVLERLVRMSQQVLIATPNGFARSRKNMERDMNMLKIEIDALLAEQLPNER